MKELLLNGKNEVRGICSDKIAGSCHPHWFCLVQYQFAVTASPCITKTWSYLVWLPSSRGSKDCLGTYLTTTRWRWQRHTEHLSWVAAEAYTDSEPPSSLWPSSESKRSLHMEHRTLQKSLQYMVFNRTIFSCCRFLWRATPKALEKPECLYIYRCVCILNDPSIINKWTLMLSFCQQPTSQYFNSQGSECSKWI